MVDDDVIIMVLSKQLTRILVKLKPHLKEYVDPLTGTMLVQILKALYGLVQSADLWFKALSSFLMSLGFKQNPLDECVMMLHTEFETLINILYVDDILMLADRKILITWLEHELEDEYETIVIDTSDTFTYLGMVVSKDENCVIDMHMIGYIENILVDWAKHSKIREVVTPATHQLFEVDENDAPLTEEMSKMFHTTTANYSTRVRG